MKAIQLSALGLCALLGAVSTAQAYPPRGGWSVGINFGAPYCYRPWGYGYWGYYRPYPVIVEAPPPVVVVRPAPPNAAKADSDRDVRRSAQFAVEVIHSQLRK